MSKANNILDLNKLVKADHKKLVELAYNLPCGVMSKYLYYFMLFKLHHEDILRYFPKRIQNKANKDIEQYKVEKQAREELKKAQEQAEPQPPVSDEQKEIHSIACGIIDSMISYANVDTVDTDKLQVMKYIQIIWEDVLKERGFYEGK